MNGAAEIKQEKPNNIKGMSSPEKVFNLDELMHISGNDQAFVIQMIEVYIRSAEDFLLQMKEAIAQKDYRLQASLVHTLASSTRHLKMHHIADKLKKIEEYTYNEQDHQKIEPLFIEVTHLLDEALPQLKSETENYSK